MARIRSVKPSFFMSRAVRKLTDKQKLVWQGLWPNADDEGRLLDEPGILTGQLWALNVTERQLEKILAELDAAGRIIRYVVAGDSYIQVTNWHEHQKISKPTLSILPPVPADYRSRSAPVGLREDYLGERKGRERKGGGGVVDAEPPLFCSLHWASEVKPPCTQCADARRVHEAWSRAQKNAPTPSPAKLTEAMCQFHEWNTAEGCGDCARLAVAS